MKNYRNRRKTEGKWRLFRQCNNIRKTKTHTDYREYRIDIFVDSLLSAYTAAAYLKVELYMAKTRLAPVSQKTAPEFELMAMALRSQLVQFLQQSSQHQPIVAESISGEIHKFIRLPALAQIN